jgi:hypothetical protein
MTRLLALVLVVLAMAAVVAGCGGSDAPKVLNTTIVVAGGKPSGGVRSLKVKEGGIVRLRIQSDTADEVHIHGYDLHKDVAKGGSVVFDFQAKDAGKFEIELEAAKQQLAALLVEP